MPVLSNDRIKLGLLLFGLLFLIPARAQIDDSCIINLVLKSTLDSIPIGSEFLPVIADSSHFFPIVLPLDRGIIIKTTGNNVFKTCSYQDLNRREIKSYIETLRFQEKGDTVVLELFNRLENISVLSIYKIKDCEILEGMTRIVKF